ncbi:MAG: hypothetical protein KDD13_03500 [Mangrovimonas sp.]|nr:hypothetical protein [Mangrovimonas sp.]HRV54358.1 hypothetical protein [Mangrovimonas sp.]
MVLNNIEKLLEKYENGETSIKEEQQLKSYFSQETVPPHLEMYKPMFTYFLQNEQEQFTKDVPLKSKSRFNLNYKWISVAAVAVLMIGFYFKSGPFSESETYSDEEVQLAYTQMKSSLEMISQNFNKGTASLDYLKEVDKGASTIGYLGEMDNATSLIFKK